MTDFHAIYEKYAPMVRRFALYLCGDSILADDITSETFVRMWTTPGPIRHETIKAYLFAITRNLYRDTLRRSRRQTVLDETLLDENVRIHEQMEVKSELEFVLVAMDELPETDRTALLMRAQRQMSYEEIAQALGLSVGAAKVRVHRARAKLIHLTRTRHAKTYRLEKSS